MILDNLLFLRLRCNETLEDKARINSQKGFKEWWNKARLTRRVASIHSKTLILEQEYIKLVKVSKYNKYVEPMTYYFKLALALICIITNVLLVVQLVGCQLIQPNEETQCSYQFFNTVIDTFSKQDVGLGFITTGIILLLSIYLLYCAHYGNTKLGLRFVIYTYSPLSPKETLYNCICYNVFLWNLWSAAIIQLLISAFKKTLTDLPQSAWLRIFYGNINGLSFHHTMYKQSIFIYMTLGISLLYFIYIFLSPSDVKFVLKSNEKKMKVYAKYKNKKEGIAEPLVEK
eukprot:CAMPEP_0168347512 /NCGR_PEP_ID=MMETSP0213-20121227/19054_1 /TAXON_ID=151035 /ORGANISM="Euplotes harpa, Strain FSP1.4" /LENGTH=286 /DNA_ID=CAMNT_0008356655 /DNA_START=591 /DNA_END=1451 /DNA_ORIENTATION=-